MRVGIEMAVAQSEFCFAVRTCNNAFEGPERNKYPGALFTEKTFKIIPKVRKPSQPHIKRPPLGVLRVSARDGAGRWFDLEGNGAGPAAAEKRMLYTEVLAYGWVHVLRIGETGMKSEKDRSSPNIFYTFGPLTLVVTHQPQQKSTMPYYE